MQFYIQFVDGDSKSDTIYKGKLAEAVKIAFLTGEKVYIDWDAYQTELVGVKFNKEI